MLIASLLAGFFLALSISALGTSVLLVEVRHQRLKNRLNLGILADRGRGGS